jgi:hypothetical protein
MLAVLIGQFGASDFGLCVWQSRVMARVLAALALTGSCSCAGVHARPFGYRTVLGSPLHLEFVRAQSRASVCAVVLSGRLAGSDARGPVLVVQV